jgi:hypothetical protein
MLTITPRCARTAAARTRASSCAAQQEDVKCQSANSNVMDAKSNAEGHNSNALLTGPRALKVLTTGGTISAKRGEKQSGQAVENKFSFATLFLFHLTLCCCKRVLTKFAAHHAAGFVGLRSRFGHCDRAVRRREQPSFAPVRSSYIGCLARHAGHPEVVKKVQALVLQSVGALRGHTGAAWLERSPGRTTRSHSREVGSGA